MKNTIWTSITAIICVVLVSLSVKSGLSELSKAQVEAASIKASVAADSKNKSSSGGGMGVDMDPCAVLVIRGDVVRVIPVESSQSAFAKLIDMVPDIMNRFTKGDPMQDEKVAEEVKAIIEDK